MAVEDNTVRRKVKMSVMKKILRMRNEFFEVYYDGFQPYALPEVRDQPVLIRVFANKWQGES